jgi:DNA-binding LacI/PurR family transcriptional regulator
MIKFWIFGRFLVWDFADSGEYVRGLQSGMKKLKTNLDRPHVALLVEASLASGRAIVQGVARYLREHGPWSIYHEPRSLTDSVPAWLKRWRGDGIIARLQTKKIAEVIAAIGVPAVDVLGVARHARIPLVHVDNAAIARAFAGARLKALWLLWDRRHQLVGCAARGVRPTRRRRGFSN